jgi:hypothetical protein
MTKQIGLRQSSTCLLLAVVALLITNTGVLAQNRAKVGDRVDSSIDNGREKGTIKQVGTGDYKDCYLVLWDYQKNTGSKGSWSCTYGQTGSLFLLDSSDRRVRDINTPAAEATKENEPARPPANATNSRVDNKNTQGGEAPSQCGGEILLKPKTKGRAASVALFKDVIKSLWDKENDPGKDNGRRVTTITSLTVGAPYRWRPLVDFQSLGTKPKTVYPVKVKYATCTEGLLQYTVAESTSEELYSCYIEEEFGEWTCSIKTAGTFKRTSFDKPAKKKITGR